MAEDEIFLHSMGIKVPIPPDLKGQDLRHLLGKPIYSGKGEILGHIVSFSKDYFYTDTKHETRKDVQKCSVFGRYRDKGWYVRSFSDEGEGLEFQGTLMAVLSHVRNERARSIKEWARRYEVIHGKEPVLPDPEARVYFIHLSSLYFALQQALTQLDEQAFAVKGEHQILPDTYILVDGNFDEDHHLVFDGDSFTVVDRDKESKDDEA